MQHWVVHKKRISSAHKSSSSASKAFAFAFTFICLTESYAKTLVVDVKIFVIYDAVFTINLSFHVHKTKAKHEKCVFKNS